LDLLDEFPRYDLDRNRDPARPGCAEDDRAPDLRCAQWCGAERASVEVARDADSGQDGSAVATAHEVLLQAHRVGLHDDVNLRPCLSGAGGDQMRAARARALA
jgi:hypothetical protein